MDIPEAQDMSEDHQPKRVIPNSRMARVEGFGRNLSADGYVFRPYHISDIKEAFQMAREASLQVTLRGAGRSYGDANIGSECIILDLCRMNQIYSFNRKTGEIDCGAGVTIEQLWRTGIEDGWWPPVVSGTMHPTLGGALAMNIHGKNAFAAGTLGEHVIEIDVFCPNGDIRTLTPTSPLFSSVISSAGLLGVITRVKLQMKRITSGDIRVLPISCQNWEEQFAAFEENRESADYMVAWIDTFGRGESSGRGLFHAGFYTEEPPHTPTLLPQHQDLPDTILGFFPKSIVWRFLKKLNNRFCMRILNWAKHVSGRLLGNGRPHLQSLVGFSFLLDYVPNWRRAYEPYGFIQYQSFVPEESARQVFIQMVEMQQERKLESFLAVMKRHRSDGFLFSHGVDGYSLALDFKLTKKNRSAIWQLAYDMNDLVNKARGRFYLAKDSTLRSDDFLQSVGKESLAQFFRAKRELDPENLLTSHLAKRIGLDTPGG